MNQKQMLFNATLCVIFFTTGVLVGTYIGPGSLDEGIPPANIWTRNGPFLDTALWIITNATQRADKLREEIAVLEERIVLRLGLMANATIHLTQAREGLTAAKANGTSPLPTELDVFCTANGIDIKNRIMDGNSTAELDPAGWEALIEQLDTLIADLETKIAQDEAQLVPLTIELDIWVERIDRWTKHYEWSHRFDHPGLPTPNATDPPPIKSISPQQGPPGVEVTIQGPQFGDTDPP